MQYLFVRCTTFQTAFSHHVLSYFQDRSNPLRVLTLGTFRLPSCWRWWKYPFCISFNPKVFGNLASGIDTKLSESISVTLLYSTLIIFTPFSITVGDIPCSNKILFDQNHIVSPGIVSYGPSTSMTNIQNSHLQNESRHWSSLNTHFLCSRIWHDFPSSSQQRVHTR